MSNYRHDYLLSSLPPPPPPLLCSPLPQPHFHSPGFYPHYHYGPPIPPVIAKFHVPTHAIQLQQYQQYQVMQRQLSNNAYQQRNSSRTVTVDKNMVTSDYCKTSRKKPFSLARCVKSSKNWIAETFCFCLIDDNSQLIDMSSNRQIHTKDT